MVKGVIGYLIKCDSILQAELVIRKLFTLMKNEYINTETNAAKTELVDLIKHHDVINENSASVTIPAQSECIAQKIT